MRKSLAALNKVYSVSAVCYGLYEAAPDVETSCDHTFTHTRATLAKFAPDVDVDNYVSLLEQAGAHCDCEVALNICS